MITYCIILLVLEVLAAGILLGAGEVGKFFSGFFGLCLQLPIFGRILGWW